MKEVCQSAYFFALIFIFSFYEPSNCDDTLWNIVKNGISEAVSVIGQEANGRSISGQNGCNCIHEQYDCGCCARIDIKEVGLDDTACVNVTYLPDQYGFSLLLIWDYKIILNETVSARNPPPICVGVPHVKVLDACIDFYNLDVSNKTFSGCAMFEADVAHFHAVKVDLGCFSIPIKTEDIINNHRYQLQKNPIPISMDLQNESISDLKRVAEIKRKWMKFMKPKE